MEFWTLKEVREKMEKEFDIQEEPDFLAAGEFTGYVNEVIDTLEQHFIKLGDYFFSSTTINLVPGQRDYDLPDDIYGTKIRQILTKDYDEVKEVKDLKVMKLLADSPGSPFKYKLINNKGQGIKLRLFPTPDRVETLDLDYTRNASRVELDGDVIDIPEAMNYMFTFLRMRLYQKEKNFAMAQDMKAELPKQEELLLDALSARTDDENNDIQPDVSIYEDHV